MICPNCKKTLADGSNFCIYCGTMLQPQSAGTAQGQSGRRGPAPDPASDARLDPGPRSNPLPRSAPSAFGSDADQESDPGPRQRATSGPRPSPKARPVQPPPKKSKRRKRKYKKRPSKKFYILLALVILLALLLALAVAGVYYFFFRTPGGLADSELTGFLPRAAVISHNETDGNTQTVEYTYAKSYTYCDVTTDARLVLTYRGSWNPAPKEEVITETEDWSRLAGSWTLADGTGPAIQITGFSSGSVTGTVSYTDSASHTVDFREAFGEGTKTSDEDDNVYYQFTGQGDFQGSYLRIERGRGVFFNNDQTPMEKDAAPKQTAAPTGSLEIERGGDTETVDPSEQAAPIKPNTLITTAVLNVRPEPNKDKTPLATVDVGTELTYTGSSNGWYQVEYQGKTGYVSGDYIQDLGDPATGTLTVLSASSELNIRSGPGTSYEVLSTLKSGDKMIALSLSDGWYEIRFNAGHAYVSADYVTVVRTVG